MEDKDGEEGSDGEKKDERRQQGNDRIADPQPTIDPEGKGNQQEKQPVKTGKRVRTNENLSKSRSLIKGVKQVPVTKKKEERGSQGARILVLSKKGRRGRKTGEAPRRLGVWDC